MDALPVLSQAKSLVQAVCGQTEEARVTQENFSRQCPVVSQIRSFGEWVSGDDLAAQKTQIEFGQFLLGVLNGIPVAGHIKGGIHYAMKDKVNGDAAMKAASHTSAVVAGGIVGMIAAGPVGACAVGAASGAATDIAITGIDSAIKKEFEPYGLLEPLNAPKDAGKWVDAIGCVALDAIVGRSAGAFVEGLAPGIGVEDVSKATARFGSTAPALAVPLKLMISMSSCVFIKVKDFVLYILKEGRVKKAIKNEFFKKVIQKGCSVTSAKELSSNKKKGNKIEEKLPINLKPKELKVDSPAKKLPKIEKDNSLKKPSVQSKTKLPLDSLDSSQSKSNVRIRVHNGSCHVYLNDRLVFVSDEGKFFNVKGCDLKEMKDDEVFSLSPTGDIKALVDKAIVTAVDKEINSSTEDVEKNEHVFVDVEERVDEVIPLDEDLLSFSDEEEHEKLLRKIKSGEQIDVLDFDSLSTHNFGKSKSGKYSDDLSCL